MKPINLKEIKKGDVFYERGGLDWYKFKALNDAKFIGQVEIMDNLYDQYKVNVLNEFGERTYLMVTEGLQQYNGKYYTNGDD
jgi:hypothetical protein